MIILSFATLNFKKIENNVEKHDFTATDLKTFDPAKAKGVVLNSLGQRITPLKGEAEITLREWPFKLSRCDQIVTFKAHYISDMGDYRHRDEGWFTITAYFANLFKDNNSEKLIRSVLLSESLVQPSHLRGTGRCVIVRSGFGDKDLTICLKDKKQEDNILRIFAYFFKCRGGMYDKAINKLDFTRMLIACGKGKGYVDPRVLYARLKKLQKLKMKKHNSIVKSRDFFHPGSDDVPGRPGVGNRDEHKEPPVTGVIVNTN